MSVFSMAGSNPALPTYPLQRSVRLRSSASAFFGRTFVGTPTTFTVSFWLKRGTLGTIQRIFGVRTAGSISNSISFTSSDILETYSFQQGLTLNTTAVYRDPSSWYHFVISTTTGNTTVYCNNVQVATSATAFRLFNSAAAGNSIGRDGDNAGGYFDGYLTEVNFIDGQALTPSSFGAYNSYGVWSPAKYTGTYGTNGFYLNFQDNSALTTTANIGIGKDSSGNGNYWTSNNISITAGTTYDSMLDVPTLTSATNANFCVMNPLNLPRGGAMSNGNLLWTSPTAEAQAVGTMYVSSGKWYWEMIENVAGGCGFGIAKDTTNINSATATTGAYTYYTNGNKYDANTGSAYGATWTNGDLIGIALDLDAGTLTFYKNNVSQGVAFTGLSGNFTALILDGTSGSTPTFNANFGQRPFTYTPPTGYNRLCTYNLPDSIVPVGAQYMAATTYTGNGSTQSITNTVNGKSFQPDLVWIKARSVAYNNYLEDSVRGVGKDLSSNLTDAEATYNLLTAFNSNGFTAFTNGTYLASNQNGTTYVAWQWRASNASAVINTSGSITSSVSANQTAGFSIVMYTGNGSAGATVGHGLGVAPSWIILKNTSSTQAWTVGTAQPAGWDRYMTLNSTAAATLDGTVWNTTNPTSSVFTLGTSLRVNGNGGTYVAYCFAAVPGYSAFGSYTGNGSADGPFVYCGFRPRWVLLKLTSSAGGGWYIYDTSRNTYNVMDLYLRPDASDAETTFTTLDSLSNGFKVRTTSTQFNGSGSTYIYAAFAENPFKNALAR